ncbi:MAG: hypothetical protein U0Z17_02850 [Bacteroidales bacterium]
MDKHGWLYKLNIGKTARTGWVMSQLFTDDINADARLAFWNQINTKLFSKGVDAPVDGCH